MSLSSPGERRIYRVDDSVFRVWVDEPDASAELLSDGEWVFTPIPSGSILSLPSAEKLTPEDVAGLLLLA